jgi:acyl-CoA synthetase (AMP-forming)/AMP-acid ligase II
MEFNIADLIEAAADAVPDRLALVAADRRLTYAELDARANRMAHHLLGRGVRRGDHLGIYAHNGAPWVETFFGAFKIGAVPINVNYRYVEDELRYLFGNADLVALIAEREYLPRIDAVRADTPLLRDVIVIEDEYEDALAKASPARDFAPRSGDDLYILYTGGTTGMPKGVIYRHEDVIMVLGGGYEQTTGRKRESPTDWSEHAKAASFTLVMMPIAPLMHGAGQWGLLNCLFGGNTAVLYTLPSFDPDAVWRLVVEEKVNTVAITGDAMGRPLAETLAAAPGKYDLSSVLALSSTAAVFSPAVKQVFIEQLPAHAVISEAIGATETGFNGLVSVKDKPLETTGGPNVTAGPGTIVLADDDTPMTPGVDTGIGRLARAGHVPLGYYKDPEKSAATFVEIAGVRYSIPGDFVRLEADGSITLLGRGSGCINSGGEKIFPEEVEKALKAHPDIFDAVVVGVPDERWGQRVAAIVQPRPGRSVTLDSLSDHCRAQLAGYKVPKQLHVVDEVMRQPSGKPDYPWAAALAAKAKE